MFFVDHLEIETLGCVSCFTCGCTPASLTNLFIGFCAAPFYSRIGHPEVTLADSALIWTFHVVFVSIYGVRRIMFLVAIVGFR